MLTVKIKIKIVTMYIGIEGTDALKGERESTATIIAPFDLSWMNHDQALDEISLYYLAGVAESLGDADDTDVLFKRYAGVRSLCWYQDRKRTQMTFLQVMDYDIAG